MKGTIKPTFQVSIGRKNITVEALSVSEGYPGGYNIELDNDNFDKICCTKTVLPDVLANYMTPGEREGILYIKIELEKVSGQRIYATFSTKVDQDPDRECHTCKRDFYSDDGVYVRNKESEFYIEGKTEEWGFYCKECYEGIKGSD